MKMQCIQCLDNSEIKIITISLLTQSKNWVSNKNKPSSFFETSYLLKCKIYPNK